MKKRLISAILSATMICSSVLSFNTPIFAAENTDKNITTQANVNELQPLRYESTTYNYRNTEDLEIENENGTVILTWPAVDKKGNPINANPVVNDWNYGMTTEDEINGYPLQSNTMPIQGMIVAVPGWSPDGTHTSNADESKALSGDVPIYYGLTDKTDKEGYKVLSSDRKKVLTLSDEVVVDPSVGFATAYQIGVKKDGDSEFTYQDGVVTVWHAKKLVRPVDADGNKITERNSTAQFKMNDAEGKTDEYVGSPDRCTTSIFINQFTEPLSMVLESDTKYTIQVKAYNVKKSGNAYTILDPDNPYRVFEKEYTTESVAEQQKAFPTVRGGGSYAQGGRGGDVYVVTNLSDSVSDPQPGSLRYGLERKDRKDGNKLAPRTIVFAVGGTIFIDPAATKNERRFTIPSNTTVAGQTAPGNGITIAGASGKIEGNDIIVRYIRFRLGEGYDADAVTPSGKNIVIDHCSMGWGVDEVFSPKSVLNTTVQWSIISEGLSIVNKNGIKNTAPELASAENEVKHGMGGIWNGYETTFHHNLLANCGTRNPRFEGAFDYNYVNYANKLEYSNNVVYNWQHNSGYGGDRGNALVNFRNNYYQPGPDTLDKVISRFFEVDGTSTIKSSYYIDGNVMMNLDGTVNEAVTNDNTLGFTDLAEQGKQLTQPVQLKIEYIPEDAKGAMRNVVENSGASIKRDAQDARLINDVLNNTGIIINSEKEAGGYDTEVYTSDIVDSDSDGMPDEWEREHKLDPNDPSDAGLIINIEDPENVFPAAYDKYSNIEAYINELAGDFNGVNTKNNTLNPSVRITNVNENKVFTLGKTYTINSEAFAYADKTIDKVEFFINDEKLGNFENGEYSWTPDKVGRFILLAKAYDSDNMQTFSTVMPVYVINEEVVPDGFTAERIGNAPLSPDVSAYSDENGKVVLDVIGSGLMGITSTSTSSAGEPDSFAYVYIPMTGDCEFSAKVKEYSKIDTFQKAGLMLRESLEPDSLFYMPTLTLLKGENYSGKDVAGNTVKARNIVSYARKFVNGSVSFDSAKRFGLEVRYVNEEETPAWVKVKKEGKKVTSMASSDGETWYTLDEYDTNIEGTYYIGFAVDGIQNSQLRTTLNLAEFSNITLNGEDLTVSDMPANILKIVLDGKGKESDYIIHYDYDDDNVVTARDAAILKQTRYSSN
ncbi:MAG: hypothetical protein IJ583_05425 [Firmicutes bacterium]|nr:hypothetical protein [Bacillota bacterium]